MKIQNKPQELDIYQKTSDDSVDEKNVLGVDGQYKWPVRIISFLLFAAAVAVNYLVGLETGEVSDRYSLWVTPPGMFFLIWAVIFSTMGLVNIYNLYKN